jgi:muramoyltetrapeptide carboxypeptidase
MYLTSGDTVALVSPARAISPEEVAPAIQFLEANGLKVVLGENIYNRHHQMAGTDVEKVNDIQRFIDDTEVKAIMSTRGGYGCVRIIDQLNLEPLAVQKKWFVGYSDVTVFHSHINKHYGTPTLHATMPINISEQPDELEAISNQTLMDALFGETLTYDLSAHTLNRPGNAEGILVGGNLSMLYSLCGSKSDIDTEGKILFLEDLDEYLYHVDRMLMNLKRTGKLKGLSALIIGGMSDMNDNTIPYGKTAEEIIAEHTSAYSYPVYYGLEAGHTKPNRALRLGKTAIIEDNKLILPS